MKKILVVLVCAMLTLSAGRAFAFIHFTQNEFTTAESLDPGMTQTGVFFTLGEDYKSYYPEIRYGLGALAEVGVKVGVTDAQFQAFADKLGPGDKLGALIGIDLKYQLIKETEGIPLDMAVDLRFDNTIVSKKNASELTFSTIFSKSFPLTERGYKLVPYGGIEMSAVYGSALPKDDTSVYAFAGIEWKLSQKFMFLLEYKGGESNIGGVGIRFEY
ncbi:MAG TPA: hypothetical protein VL197_01550 [Nitrospirota bacterium]|nr:hypothetical protein [Nitrospirota bacterium]